MAKVIEVGRDGGCQQTHNRLPDLGSSQIWHLPGWNPIIVTTHFCRHRTWRGETDASRAGVYKAEPGSKPYWGQSYSLCCNIYHCFRLLTTYYSCTLNFNHVQWLAVPPMPCCSEVHGQTAQASPRCLAVQSLRLHPRIQICVESTSPRSCENFPNTSCVR